MSAAKSRFLCGPTPDRRVGVDGRTRDGHGCRERDFAQRLVRSGVVPSDRVSARKSWSEYEAIAAAYAPAACRAPAQIPLVYSGKHKVGAEEVIRAIGGPAQITKISSVRFRGLFSLRTPVTVYIRHERFH